ncbi:MAG: ABC transporter permease [Lactobacillales bacterium]|jgi:putative ABC transport system permease protein|nr:ABC transporter permease [Lactobacillales bacterium]
MNFIKRAWQYLLAKKGKSVLLIVTLSAILAFVLAGLTIKQASDAAIENTKKDIGATVTLSIKREYSDSLRQAAMSSANENGGDFKMSMPSIDATEADTLVKLAGVKSYSLTSSTQASGTDAFTPQLLESSTTDTSSSQPGVSMNDRPMGGAVKEMTDTAFTVSGTNDLATTSLFAAKTAKIVDGTGTLKDNEAVIDSALAVQNSLKVGDKFSITKTLADSSVVTKELTIVGTYTSTAAVNEMAARMPMMNPVNTIYTNNTFVGELKNDTSTYDNVSLELSDPAEKDSFIAAADKKIDTSKYELTTDDDMYQSMLQPLENISGMAQNVVLLVAVAGAIILTLIVILTVRERKFEIGVLLALGENKGKIIGQYFVELFLLAVIAMGIASASGNVIGNAVGNQLLTQQTAAAEVSDGGLSGGNVEVKTETNGGGPGGGSHGGGFGGGPGKSFGIGQTAKEIEQIDNLNVKVTGENLAKLAGIAVAIILFATIIACIGILRMSPKAILSSY